MFCYSSPPEGEVRFKFNATAAYKREIVRCTHCGHFLSIHDMDAQELYSGDYVDSTYSGNGLRRAFDRIISLDPAESDNVGRVKRVLEFASTYLETPREENRTPTVLDVGSGLCVFLHRMKSAGWDCTALDPDPRAADHSRETVGVKAVCGDFLALSDIGRYDLVTFNKVLEHVKDPVKFLAKSAEHLLPGGFVYIELPDGEVAVAEGPGREEFFIDHWHVFSVASLRQLAVRAGFSVMALERLREPSTKYTLRAFLRPAKMANCGGGVGPGKGAM